MNVDINDLTLGQIKELVKQFNSSQPSMIQSCNSSNFAESLIGKFCIIRCYSAGVHSAKIVSVSGDCAIVSESVRLWKWKAKEGIALSGVAQFGIDKSESKLDSINPNHYLTGVIEIIPMSDIARGSIYE